MFFSKAWWALVTVAPEVSKIKVFNKGTPHGLIISIPAGGHIPPILKTGDRLEWKNVQKKLTKNKAKKFFFSFKLKSEKKIFFLKKTRGKKRT